MEQQLIVADGAYVISVIMGIESFDNMREENFWAVQNTSHIIVSGNNKWLYTRRKKRMNFEIDKDKGDNRMQMNRIISILMGQLFILPVLFAAI